MNSSIMPEQQLPDAQAVSLTGRMLGAVLYYSPDSDDLAPILDLLQHDEWSGEWPCGEDIDIQRAAALISSGLTSDNAETLAEAYQRLFIGPDALPAPPWGSVYLDHESVIFGDSTLALRNWQAELGIEVQQQQREPEDHIGLLLMLAAWLAESRPEHITPLLAEHLLPWSGRFLALLEEKAEHPFYQGMALLTRIALDDWQQRYSPIVIRKQLFF
ncbi:Tat proofreading chaperone DmsD [Budvicia diplopodorum]|uniref:Tat proofreading chaperone DmsD n=1 Tax=Budvicia diplopodorum TaxID=1119056 RepID=UPI001BABBC73|nr:Tat proofreading chaperone DmsD [Budvicia diplopodorum]